jgi:type II secretory pathway pseudopilin PulG
MNRPRCRGEAGESLVELLITISILGIAVVALLTGLATAIRFSGTHRTYANADVVLGAAAESVKSAAPVACPLSGTAYNSALSSSNANLGVLPSPWTASNLKITARACSSGADSALALQTITITATAPGGGPSQTIDVVKRSPS